MFHTNRLYGTTIGVTPRSTRFSQSPAGAMDAKASRFGMASDERVRPVAGGWLTRIGAWVDSLLPSWDECRGEYDREFGSLCPDCGEERCRCGGCDA